MPRSGHAELERHQGAHGQRSARTSRRDSSVSAVLRPVVRHKISPLGVTSIGTIALTDGIRRSSRNCFRLMYIVIVASRTCGSGMPPRMPPSMNPETGRYICEITGNSYARNSGLSSASASATGTQVSTSACCHCLKAINSRLLSPASVPGRRWDVPDRLDPSTWGNRISMPKFYDHGLWAVRTDVRGCLPPRSMPREKPNGGVPALSARSRSRTYPAICVRLYVPLWAGWRCQPDATTSVIMPTS